MLSPVEREVVRRVDFRRYVVVAVVVGVPLICDPVEMFDPAVFVTGAPDWHEGDLLLTRGGERFRILAIEPTMDDEVPFHATWTVEPLPVRAVRRRRTHGTHDKRRGGRRLWRPPPLPCLRGYETLMVSGGAVELCCAPSLSV
jgi:hypothetical protein